MSGIEFITGTGREQDKRLLAERNARTAELLSNAEEYIEAKAQRDRLLSALNWACGCNERFRPREVNEGAYWWRRELRERAGVWYDGEKYVFKGPGK